MMPRGQRYITWHKCYFYLHVCYLTGYLGMCHSGATALVYTMIYKKNKTQLVTVATRQTHFPFVNRLF